MKTPWSTSDASALRGLEPYVHNPSQALNLLILVAQCSATPATVAVTPPCSATPFQTQISVRHLPARGGGRCDTKIFRGCSATPVLHLQNTIKSRTSAATRVVRHVWRDRGYPQSCATKLLIVFASRIFLLLSSRGCFKASVVWGEMQSIFGSEENRTLQSAHHPHKAMMNIASAILGVVYILLFS